MKSIIIYFNKTHRIMAALSYIYGGYGTYWMLHLSGIHPLYKAISGILFGLLLTIGVVSMIKFIRKEGQSGITKTVQIPKKLIDDTFEQHKEKGITKFLYDDYGDILKQFSTRATLIKIIVYHGEGILSATKQKIIDAINNNTEVRLLIAKKESVLLKEVWDLEDKKEETRVTRVYDIIEEIKNSTGTKAINFKVNEYNTQARYAFVAFDSRWAWWTPYHPGKRVEKTTSFILTDAGKKSIIHECIEHFNALWNKVGINKPKGTTT